MAHAKYSRVDPVYESGAFPVINIKGNQSALNRYHNWLLISMQIQRKQSKAFVEKTKRLLLGNLTKEGLGRNWFIYLAYVASNLFRLRSVFSILGLVPILGQAIRGLLWMLVIRNEDLEALLEKNEPHLIIVVSNGQEPMLAEVQKIRSLQNSWIFLPDNWDNVFTKCLFESLPRTFWVWSEQQKSFLISNRAVSPQKIQILGSSRMRNSRLLESQKLALRTSLSPNIKLAYLGQEAPHNETSDLRTILKSCAWANLHFGSKFEVHYRPHPTARPRSERCIDATQLLKQEEFLGFASLIIHRDESLAPLRSIKNKSNYDFLASMNIVLGAPTTMLLEAVTIGLPTGVFLSDDKWHRSSSFQQWNHMPHFNGMNDLVNFHILNNEADVKRFLEDFIRPKKSSSGDKSSLVEFFTGPLDDGYNERLNQLICMELQNPK